MRRRTWVTGLLAAVLAVPFLAACAEGGWEDECTTSPQGVIECAPGKRPAAPALTGELLDGTRYELSRDRGQVVVINFWGSWCAPCRAEVDDLEETYQATRDRGVVFLGINVRDDLDKARAFHEGRTSYPSIFDPGGRTALDFDVPPNSIPATIILDREGRIAVVIRRATVVDELRPLVERVAAEQGGT
ncbi:MAG TPA: TlpA disulfide reductase family protein [Micromonosporaceae bacterium]